MSILDTQFENHAKAELEKAANERLLQRSDVDTTPSGPMLVKPDQAAAYVGLSRPHIYRLAAKGAFPAPRKIGGATRWVLSELTAWVSALPDADFAGTK